MNTQSNDREEKESSNGKITLTTILIWIGAFIILFPIFQYLFIIVWYIIRALLATIIGS